jgi:CheY-like chemotaxis protein
MRRDVPALSHRQNKILVVDDGDENRALLRYLFGPPEFILVEAADGTEGLALAALEVPDCVLLDLQLPELSGFAVLERIEADARLRDVPVIIITAMHEPPESMQRALRTGAIDYITRPISPLQARARVRGAIERRRLLRDVQRLPAWLPPAAVPGLRAHLDEIAMYAELLQQREHAPEDVRRTYVSRIHQACRQVIARAGEFVETNGQHSDVRCRPASPPDSSRAMEELAHLSAPGGRGQDLRVGVPRWAAVGHAAAGGTCPDHVLRNVLTDALTFRATGGRL